MGMKKKFCFGRIFYKAKKRLTNKGEPKQQERVHTSTVPLKKRTTNMFGSLSLN